MIIVVPKDLLPFCLPYSLYLALRTRNLTTLIIMTFSMQQLKEQVQSAHHLMIGSAVDAAWLRCACVELGKSSGTLTEAQLYARFKLVGVPTLSCAHLCVFWLVVRFVARPCPASWGRPGPLFGLPGCKLHPSHPGGSRCTCMSSNGPSWSFPKAVLGPSL